MTDFVVELQHVDELRQICRLTDFVVELRHVDEFRQIVVGLTDVSLVNSDTRTNAATRNSNGENRGSSNTRQSSYGELCAFLAYLRSIIPIQPHEILVVKIVGSATCNEVLMVNFALSNSGTVSATQEQ